MFDNDHIIYCSYDNESFMYIIYNNFIKIIKDNHPLQQIIYCYKKNLKVYRVIECYIFKEIYVENRNNNNEIISFKKYDKDKLKEEFISNNNNPPFSKSLKKFCIKIINNCNKNINYYFKIIKSLLKKEKIGRYNLLLNYNLEMINSK